MTSPTVIGTALRDARRSQGLDINDCAAAIFVRARYLTAIEDGRFDDLPDPAYVGGFVRAYADHLGVRLEGFAEPDHELPVRGEPDRRGRPVYLPVTRTSGGVGRRAGWILWFAVFVIALLVVGAAAVWLGVIDLPDFAGGAG